MYNVHFILKRKTGDARKWLNRYFFTTNSKSTIIIHTLGKDLEVNEDADFAGKFEKNT